MVFFFFVIISLILHCQLFSEPLQHALIHEADNVAESEDSEDEWNYYRVDPNKEKNSETNPVNEPEKTRNVEEESEISESENQPVEDTETKIQSGNVEEDIKCEDLKEESPELINIEVAIILSLYHFFTIFLIIILIIILHQLLSSFREYKMYYNYFYL